MAISETKATGASDSVSSSQLLAKADAMLFKLESALNFCAGVMIFLVMVLGVVQIFGRSIFNWPIPAYVDKIEITMPIFAFLGIAYCQRLGGHVRMEIILKQFKGRSHWIAESFAVVINMVIIGLLIIYTYDHFLRAFQNGDSTIDGDYPVWPSKLLIPIAFTLMFVRLGINLLGYLRLVRWPDAVPVAIPHTETVEELAEHEIKTSGLSDDEVAELSLRRAGGER
jgi:C4-dicarboxylate transporter, DctQ subunit